MFRICPSQLSIKKKHGGLPHGVLLLLHWLRNASTHGHLAGRHLSDGARNLDPWSLHHWSTPHDEGFQGAMQLSDFKWSSVESQQQQQQCERQQGYYAWSQDNSSKHNVAGFSFWFVTTPCTSTSWLFLPCLLSTDSSHQWYNCTIHLLKASYHPLLHLRKCAIELARLLRIGRR